ncbi:MAG: hypothetical protein KF819_14890 [Labilithrix sp.]|nr:hypothetical protein [Labilithrix sp.]
MTRLFTAVVVASLLSLTSVTVAHDANATEVAPKASLPELVEEGHRWLAAATRPAAPAAKRAVLEDEIAPRASIVARDWHGSMKLAGARTVILDDVRPTASSRMIIGRISNDAQLTIFTQIGVGEWRVDTVMFPAARSYAEVAGQLGAGFELHVAPDVRIAGEGQYTFLFRDAKYGPDEVAPRMASCVLALKATF